MARNVLCQVWGIGWLAMCCFGYFRFMRLWSIQNAAVCEQLERRSVIRADGRRVWKDFRPAYQWLIGQMKQKIGLPPKGVTYPMWSWYELNGRRKRPDMRVYTRGFCKQTGTPLVLITFEAPDDQVVLSDFNTWHFVLNDCYMFWEENPDYSEEEKENSWENIFDLTESYWKPEDREQKLTIQATTWEIRKEWIKKVEHFRSR